MAGQDEQAELPDVPGEVDVEAARRRQAGDPAQESSLGDLGAGEPAVQADDPGQPLRGDPPHAQPLELGEDLEVADHQVGVLERVGRRPRDEEPDPAVADAADRDERDGREPDEPVPDEVDPLGVGRGEQAVRGTQAESEQVVLDELADVLDEVEALEDEEGAQGGHDRAVADEIVAPLRGGRDEQEREHLRDTRPDRPAEPPDTDDGDRRREGERRDRQAGPLARVDEGEDREAARAERGESGGHRPSSVRVTTRRVERAGRSTVERAPSGQTTSRRTGVAPAGTPKCWRDGSPDR